MPQPVYVVNYLDSCVSIGIHQNVRYSKVACDSLSSHKIQNHQHKTTQVSSLLLGEKMELVVVCVFAGRWLEVGR